MGIADGFQGRSKNPRLTFHTLHPEFHASEHFSFLRVRLPKFIRNRNIRRDRGADNRIRACNLQHNHM
jgi:hypothetical protein